MDASKVETDRCGYSPLTFAYFLGALPLVAGCAIFLLWCATYWEWLEVAGMLNVFLGLIAVLAGVACLAVHFVGAFRQHPIAWRRVALGIPAVAVLVANFPVCGVIMDTVFHLQNAQRLADVLSQSTIRVVNAGEAPVKSVVVNGVLYDGDLGAIPPGEGTSLFFNAAEDQPLTVNLTSTRTGEQTVYLPSAGNNPVDIVVVVGAAGDVRIVSIVPRQSGAAD